MKKNSRTPINSKKYSCYGLKNHTKNLITKKNSCGSKILPALNFSNGPSLNYTCFKQATSSKRNTSLKAVKTHGLKFNDPEKSSLSRNNAKEKVQLLMHQKILIFSSAYSCASFLP